MNDYFVGAVTQMIARGQHLIYRIPSHLPRDFHVLSDNCQKDLAHTLDELRELLEDPRLQSPALQPVRLRRFKRAVAEMDFIETLGLSALERANTTDHRLNRLMEAIWREIAYPLIPPVVTSLSQEYFHIYPRLNLLFVPPGEGDFLLHLPDLYHELAHPLTTPRYNLKVKPFQEALAVALTSALEYLDDEIVKERRRRGPDNFLLYLETWQRAWIEAWTEEFFCDLFAIYTLGPAYAWSHLHLCAKRGDNPFSVPLFARSTHPADDARMRAMLMGLKRVGFDAEVHDLTRQWEELDHITGFAAEPEYRRCFPDGLLSVVAEKAHDGVTAIRCRVVSPDTKDPVHYVLNQAWKEFWNDPMGYAAWEKEAVESLNKICEGDR